MSYTIIITTPVETVNDTPETCQIEMTITVNSTGSNTSWDSLTHGIRIVKWGELTQEYDIEEALMVPSEYQGVLGDSNGELFTLLYETPDVDVKFYVKVKINGSQDFDGYVIEDGLEYDKGLKQLTINVMPKMDILNNTSVMDENGNMLNPYGFPSYNVQFLTDYLMWIYQLVDSSLSPYTGSIKITHDWNFRGTRTGDGHICDNIKLNELKFFWNPVNAEYGVSSVADVLKTMAVNFCAFTGMTGQSQAFFKKLFYYDPSNLQTLGTVYNHKVLYRVQLLDYVKIRLKLFTTTPPILTDHEQGDANKSNITNKAMSKEIYLGFFTDLSGHFPPGDTQAMQGVLTRGTADDGVYQITAVSDSSIDGGEYKLDIHDLISLFWYNYRHNIVRLRTDLFTVKGIGYNFMKDFNYNGYKYQPISVKKHLSDSKTDIEAIHLGAL